MSKLKDMLSGIFQGAEISEDIEEHCVSEIKKINHTRVRRLILVTISLEIVMIMFNLWTITLDGANTASITYMTMYVLFGSVLTCSYLFWRKYRHGQAKQFNACL